jgi:uncharacterized membrane protein
MLMNNNIIVTVASQNMRSWGRQALAGKWKTAVLGTLIYYVVSSAPLVVISALFKDINVVNFAANVYTILVIGPLMLGYYVFMIAIFRKHPGSPSEVFYGFERFGKAFSLFIVMMVRIMLWSILLIVPGIIAAFRYSLAFYVLADNPDIPIIVAIEESKRMMQGNKWKYFCLQMSFIGWALLATAPSTIATMLFASHEITSLYANIIPMLLSVGMLWVMPYITASTVGFYEVANGNLRRQESAAEMIDATEVRLPAEGSESTAETDPTEAKTGTETETKTDDSLKVEVRIRK